MSVDHGLRTSAEEDGESWKGFLRERVANYSSSATETDKEVDGVKMRLKAGTPLMRPQTWTSLAVQWLRLRASNAGGAGSIPGWGSSAY